MPVSLTKTYAPIAAGNAVVGTRFLLPSGIEVRVTNRTDPGRGRVVLSVTTPNGAILVRTYPVGQTFAPVPAPQGRVVG